ncbi:MAG: hypothetical protein L0Z70_08605 [Chloroflexi bacterium]|nr:hypothetical protein [Chloroflexota bacterium]
MGKSNRVHQEQIESSLPGDLMQEYQAISRWIQELFQVHCDGIIVKVIDAASVEGVIKSLRYRTRRFPAVIVNREARFTGAASFQSAASEIHRFFQGRNAQTGSA